jgi:hypothetical protein
MAIETKISKGYLKEKNWKWNENGYYVNGEFLFDWVNEVLNIGPKHIHNVETIEALERIMKQEAK